MRLDLTVGVPMYQSAEFLPDLFASLDAQEVLPKQLLLLDDASPDQCLSVANDLAQRHRRLCTTVLRNEVNLGIAGTYNRLIDLADQPWLQIIDADDYPLPGYYSTLKPLLALPATAILSGMRSNSRLVSIVNSVIPRLVPRRVPHWLPMLGSLSTRSGVIYRTAVIRDTRFMDPQFDGSDILHLQELRCKGEVTYEPRARMFYRIHTHAKSTSKNSSASYQAAMRERRLPFTFHLDFYLRRRALSFVRGASGRSR